MAAEIGYRAFISYSHMDERWARYIHRKLERYRLPASLARKRTECGDSPICLRPIFRDRDELPAGQDLRAEIEAALRASDALIIICSPSAATSVWVDKEVAFFRHVRPNAQVLCLIVNGEPNGSLSGAPELSCFPPALYGRGIEEPIAADIRKTADGRRLALLKIVAGLTGLRLDNLVQRDAQHRIKRVMSVTVCALVGMIAMAVMSYVAVESGREAVLQRTKAEGLVDYMLTDLRPLVRETVGQRSVLRSISARLNAYYEDVSLENLPTGSLELYAYVIYADGKDAEDQENLAQAFLHYSAFHDISTELLAREPGDPQRLLVHADSENRLGLHFVNGSDPERALMHLRSAQALLERIPSNRRDAVDANGRSWDAISALVSGNTCVALLRGTRGAEEALSSCENAIVHNQRWLETNRDDNDAHYSLVFHILWLSDALRQSGRVAEAEQNARAYISKSQQMIQRRPDNLKWQRQWLDVLMHRADTLISLSRPIEAKSHLREALIAAERLARSVPGDETLKDRFNELKLKLSEGKK